MPFRLRMMLGFAIVQYVLALLIGRINRLCLRGSTWPFYIILSDLSSFVRKGTAQFLGLCDIPACGFKQSQKKSRRAALPLRLWPPILGSGREKKPVCYVRWRSIGNM